MYARGCTEMEPSIDALNEKIRSIPRGTPVRLVVLSDGELFDTDETCAASSRYAAELREHTRINSQVRRDSCLSACVEDCLSAVYVF